MKVSEIHANFIKELLTLDDRASRSWSASKALLTTKDRHHLIPLHAWLESECSSFYKPGKFGPCQPCVGNRYHKFFGEEKQCLSLAFAFQP